MSLTYEEFEKRKKELAQKIWDNPYLEGLEKFKKEELLFLLDELISAYCMAIDSLYMELDIKDCLWQEKCVLIELLDPDFFKKIKEDKRR